MADNVTWNATDPEGCPVPNSTTFTATCQLLAYSAILIISIFGNSILIGAIISYPRAQTVMNYYIINMAAADLLTTVFDMAVQVWHYGLMIANKPFEWLHGSAGVFLCKFVVFIQGTAIACTVFTLAAIAVNRFLAVMFPLRRSRRKRTTAVLLFLIWMCSFAIASPMLYVMRVHEVQGVHTCLENWEPLFDGGSSPKRYTLALFGSLYVLPLLIIGILYSVIAFKVWGRTVPGNSTAPNQLHEIETRKKILKICMTVVFVFALCWLPFYIYLMMLFVAGEHDDCGPPEYVAFLGLFFGHANSSINPFIYIIFNSDYKKGMKKVLRRCNFPYKSNRVRMHFNRGTLNSFPSLRTFKELEMGALQQYSSHSNNGFNVI